MNINMRKELLMCFLVLLLGTSISSQESIEEFMDGIADISYERVKDSKEGHAVYKLEITQPVDHMAKGGPKFSQRVFLTHVGKKRPTVMSTQGYNVRYRENEVAMILDGNHLNIEHRYFATSVPENKDWQYLTLEQATADLHKINVLFKQYYTDKWVSTGISKGGQTTIYYRYFYPEDVDVSIPYVAPFNYNMEDKRIYHFLDTISTPECRKKVFNVQKVLLKKKDKVLDRLQWYEKGKDLTFDYLDGLETAYEFAVLEYPFSVWQWGTACEDIPTDKKDLDGHINHLLDVVGFDFYDDKTMDFFAAHYYQASTQMGYYGFKTAKYDKWLDKVGKNPSASFPPKDSNAQFDDSLIQKVDKWLGKAGNNILYINGLGDTWSATRVIPSKKVNSKAFNLAGIDHGGARIKNMTAEMQEDFKETLESMLKRQVDLEVLNEDKD